MALISTQSIDNDGLNATYSAVSASDTFSCSDGTFLHVKNADATAVTVTVVTPGTLDGLAIGDRAVSVPAGENRFIATPAALYRASDGLGTVQFTGTSIAATTAAVLRA